MGGHRAPPTSTVAFDVEGQENARLGVLYLFGNLDPIPNILSVAVEGILGIASQGMTNGGKATVDAIKTTATTLSSVGEKVVMGNSHAGATESVSAFRKWAEGLLKKLIAEIKIKFKEPKFIVGSLKGLINAFVRLFAKEVAPFVKGVMDMVKGLAKAAPLIVTKIQTWWRSREVTLIEGHPTLMVNSIKRAMTLGIFEGLYIAIKGAVDIAITSITAGAAALVKVVIAFAEAAVKIVWRMFELIRIDDFCSKCRRAFAGRNAASALHKNPAAFTKMYKKYAMAVPVIAALTLNSGICGDKMRFIQLFNGDGSVISQSSFDSGVAMIDGLKPFAGQLLRNMGFGLVVKKGSEEALVKALINQAKAEPAPITTRGKVIKFVNDVLTL